MMKGEADWVELGSREHKGGWVGDRTLEWRHGKLLNYNRDIGNQAEGSSAPELLAIQLPSVHKAPSAVPTSQLRTAPNAPN